MPSKDATNGRSCTFSDRASQFGGFKSHRVHCNSRKRSKGRTGFLDEAAAIRMTLGSFMTRKKKTLIGAAMVPTGILMWFASPYLRADSLHLSVLVGLVSFSVVFLTGFIMTLYGAGLILVDNDLWGD